MFDSCLGNLDPTNCVDKSKREKRIIHDSKKMDAVTGFSWFLKSLWTVTVAAELKDACSLEGAMTNLDSMLKSKDITLSTLSTRIKFLY